ncbi:uncharacterized protein isoform X1 [Musca autumnalis]|uniref:uncharacterized protein isoform X1 n=1 Tax=Musca autumnalis TaxID=221902 RepID=UPI003CEA8DD4
MSEFSTIKIEPFANDCKEESSNKDPNTLTCNTIKLENVTNMVNDLKEDELDLDNMEEFLPENVEQFTIDIIKKEEPDEMDEFLITQDEEQQQNMTQHHIPGTITPQISVTKLEIIDVHKDELQSSSGPEANDSEEGSMNVSMVSNKKVRKYKKSVILSSRVAQTPTEHKCNICGKYYTESKNLLAHIRKKHPSSMGSEYICKICNQGFATERGLGRHSNQLHPVAQTYSTKHKCKICGCSYVRSRSLRVHMKNKHPLSINAKYVCEICHRRFGTPVRLATHYRKMHHIPKTEPSVNDCTEEHKRKLNNNGHEDNDNDQDESGEVSMVSNNNVGKYEKSDNTCKDTNNEKSPAEHKCDVCGKRYSEYRNLLAHIRKNHPSSMDSNYMCEICNQGFATQRGLGRHSNRVHPVAQTHTTKHKCKICGSSYIRSRSLRVHMKNKHPLSINAKYICELCHRRFGTPVRLATHYRKKHQTQLPVPSDKSTGDELSSNGQEGNEQDDSREISMFSADKVGKYEKSDKTCEDTNNEKSAILSSHVAQTPTEHQCDICGKCYTESKKLLRHKRNTHPLSMDLEYICEICNERFATQRGLGRHSKRIHSVAQTPTSTKH